MRRERVFLSMLSLAFFLWLHFWLRTEASARDTGAGGVLCNPGGPFGVHIPGTLLLIAGWSTIVFLVWQWKQETSDRAEWAWILLLSGALGNILERSLFGCIVDYIDPPFFPVFNMADILLGLGVLGIFFHWYRSSPRNHERGDMDQAV